MKFPKTIKIGGITYKIVFVKPSEIDGNMGEFHSEILTIKINEELPDELKKLTILHETIEAINWKYELELDHSAITIMETAMYQVIKENKNFIRGIIDKE